MDDDTDDDGSFEDVEGIAGTVMPAPVRESLVRPLWNDDKVSDWKEGDDPETVPADRKIELADIVKRLARSYMLELDPRSWPGGKQSHNQMTGSTRHARYWAKTNARLTGVLLQQAIKILTTTGIVDEDPEVGKAVEAAKEQVAGALRLVRSKR